MTGCGVFYITGCKHQDCCCLGCALIGFLCSRRVPRPVTVERNLHRSRRNWQRRMHHARRTRGTGSPDILWGLEVDAGICFCGRGFGCRHKGAGLSLGTSCDRHNSNGAGIYSQLGEDRWADERVGASNWLFLTRDAQCYINRWSRGPTGR